MKADETESKEDMRDNVKHPAHYDLPGLPVESIDVVRAVLGPEGFRKFCRGNALKYLIRADKKGGAEDLQKAMVYINWELSGLHADSFNGVFLKRLAKAANKIDPDKEYAITEIEALLRDSENA